MHDCSLCHLLGHLLTQHVKIFDVASRARMHLSLLKIELIIESDVMADRSLEYFFADALHSVNE